MSVLSLERPEEFPELAEVCKRSFARSIEAKSHATNPLRTEPTCILVTDVDQSIASIECAHFAAEVFFAVATATTTGSLPSDHVIKTHTPAPTHYTIEADGQSEGCSAYALAL